MSSAARSAREVIASGGSVNTMRFYGQEVNLTTSASARMNLFLHDIEEGSGEPSGRSVADIADRSHTPRIRMWREHDMVMAPERETIVAGSGEIDELAAFERLFAAQEPSVVPARLIGPDGNTVELPHALYAVLLRAAHELAAGNGISILPVEAMLTTQQAADLLNISRPHLIKMLEAAEMPFRMVGTHRRIRLEDVLDYQRRRDERAQAGLANMARAALLDGTYDAMPDDE